MPTNLENSAVATGLEKVKFSFQYQKRQCQRMFKLLTIALISHASKVMLKILQARLQQYVNHEIPDVQAGFRKGRGTRHQIVNIHWIMEKAREFQNNISFAISQTLLTLMSIESVIPPNRLILCHLYCRAKMNLPSFK